MKVTWAEGDAAEASFLAVVPPIETAQRIEDVQRRAGIDVDVLPHITVKSQPGLNAAGEWREAVDRALVDVCPFDVAFPRIERFNDGILYLAVAGPIRDLHWALLVAVEPVVGGDRFEYDGDGFVPHLTLGATFAGATSGQLLEIEREAAAFVGGSFGVSSVVEFYRAGPEQPYRPLNDFQLRG